MFDGGPQIQTRECTTSDYAEIGFDTQPVTPQKPQLPVAQATDSATKVPSASTTVESPSESAAQGACAEKPVDKNDGYAQVRKRSVQEEPVPPVSSSTAERSETEGGEDEYGYSKVQPRINIEAPEVAGNGQQGGSDPDRTPGDGADSGEELEEEDELYMNAVSRPDPDPIPELPHPLSQTDTAPLKGVLEFLSNNRQVCRRSYYDARLSGDPVANMKKLLEELSVG